MPCPARRTIRENTSEERKRNVKRRNNIWAICALLCAMCFAGAACQPTPQRQAVAGKNDGKLEQALESTAPAAAYEAPERWECEMEGAKDTAVTFAADVELPEIEQYAVYELQPCKIAEAEAQALIEAIVGDAQLYARSSVRTKADVQKDIDRYTQEIEEVDTEDMAATYAEMLAELMREYAAAPEHVAREPITRELRFYEDVPQLVNAYGETTEQENGIVAQRTDAARRQAEADGNAAILGTAQNEDGYTYDIEIVNMVRPGWKDRSYASIARQEQPVPDPDFSAEQARGVAQAFIQRSGFDFSIYSVDAVLDMDGETPVAGVYEIALGRNMPNTARKQVQAAYKMQDTEQDFAAPVWEEALCLTVDSCGISALHWNEPQTIVETANSSVALLPFGEVQEKILQHIRNTGGFRGQFMDEDGEKIISRRICISRVALSYAAVRKKDAPDAMLFVPVWDVCGEVYLQFPEGYGAADHQRHRRQRGKPGIGINREKAAARGVPPLLCNQGQAMRYGPHAPRIVSPGHYISFTFFLRFFK